MPQNKRDEQGGRDERGTRDRTEGPPPGRPRRVGRLVVIGGAIVAIAVAVGYFAYRAAADLPGVLVADQGNRHIQTFDETHAPYNSDPPTSGPHMPYIAPWGVHTEPVPRELQVHNLEDGGVMVQYRCATPCPELVARLRAIVERYPHEVILAPYPTMKSAIALTAWTRIDAFDRFDEARIVRFIAAYRGIDHHKRVE